MTVWATITPKAYVFVYMYILFICKRAKQRHIYHQYKDTHTSSSTYYMVFGLFATESLFVFIPFRKKYIRYTNKHIYMYVCVCSHVNDLHADRMAGICVCV